MTYIFEEWKEVLEKFQKCVDQGVEEMHQQKEEVQQSVKAQNANENKGAQAAEKAQSVPAGAGGDAQ